MGNVNHFLIVRDFPRLNLKRGWRNASLTLQPRTKAENNTSKYALEANFEDCWELGDIVANGEGFCCAGSA